MFFLIPTLQRGNETRTLPRPPSFWLYQHPETGEWHVIDESDCDRLPGEVDALNGKVEALRS